MDESDILSDSESSFQTIYIDKDHFRNSYSSFYEFYLDGSFCDAKILVCSEVINCHKMVLSGFSGYFRSMFFSDMKESRQGIVTLNDIDFEVLNLLIRFAYTSQISITTDNVQPLLYACSVLQIDSVAGACCTFMASHLDIINCLEVRNFAEVHGYIGLVLQTEAFIRDNFVEVSSSDDFLNLPYISLCRLVESNDLTVDREEQVFEAVIRWIQIDIVNKEIYLFDLLKRVRLAFVDPSYLVGVVRSNSIIHNSLQCRDLIDEATHYQMFKANVISDFHITPQIKPRKHYAGVIFCVGGRGSAGHPFKTIECYDVVIDKWFSICDMSTRRRHVGVITFNGKLYAIGGHDGQGHLKSGEVFDPKMNTWESIADMSKLRRGLALAYLNGCIYAVGGLDDTSCFALVEKFDPQSNSWSHVADMNTSRGGVAVVSYKNHLYAMGGNNGTVSLESCERFDPEENRWVMLPCMNKRRAGAGATELNGYIYVAGGFDDNSPLDSVEFFNPVLDSWTRIASMSIPRGGVGIAALAGKIYAVGGHDGSHYLCSVEEYDPANEKWNPVASVNTCRAGAGVVVVACSSRDLKTIDSPMNQTHNSSTAGEII